VIVLDINDNTPEFSQSLYTVDMSEAVAPGTTVLTLSAVDHDQDQHLFYTIYSVTSPASNNKFKINSVSGTLSQSVMSLFYILLTRLQALFWSKIGLNSKSKVILLSFYLSQNCGLSLETLNLDQSPNLPLREGSEKVLYKRYRLRPKLSLTNLTQVG